MKAAIGNVKNYFARFLKENKNISIGFAGVNVNIPLMENGKIKPSRKGFDAKDTTSPFVQESLGAIISFYNAYENAKEVVYCQAPYVETVPLKKGDAGFEFGVDVNEIKVRFLKAKYTPPVRIKNHFDKSIELFKEIGKVRKASDGDWENDVTVKIADMNVEKREIVIQPATYFDQVGTNLTLDWASGALGETASYTLRNDIEKTVKGTLPRLKNSVLANTLGVAVVLVSRGEDVLIPIRGSEQAVMVDGKGKFHCSASGVFSWDMDDTNLADIDFEFFINGMAREIHSEIGLLKSEYSLTPLAFSRELIRGGKPQLFFIAETEMGLDELKEKMVGAEESWEFLSVDDLAEDSQLRPHLNSPLEAPQEMFTYEGWMALHVAMAYIRDEEPPFEIL
ncbi:hypothetical protein IT895_05500 [Halomonas sp. A40-4]|uniref:hypothetical protein n=1 Tax=Halomonas sp. A40-4 TaxID=2785909 RepID=UPI0018EF9056|nr:hypothetical protein [Halomonas sp. A40-4]QPL47232.1 hypothetical protein IT895_05500 [Halomonas sp. A40-4]